MPKVYPMVMVHLKLLFILLTRFLKRCLHHAPACNGANVSFFESPFMEWILEYVLPVSLSRPGLAFPFLKKVLFFINVSRPSRRSLLIFEIQLPIFFIFVEYNQQDKMVKVSQKYIYSILTYFRLLTWAVYSCSEAVEQPPQAMFCCISAVSYD